MREQGGRKREGGEERERVDYEKKKKKNWFTRFVRTRGSTGKDPAGGETTHPTLSVADLVRERERRKSFVP